MKYALISLIAVDSDKIPTKNVNTVVEIINKLTNIDLILFSGWTLSNKSELNQIIKKITNNKSTFILEIGDGYRSNKNDEFGFYIVKGRKIIKNAIKQIFMDSQITDFKEENKPVQNIKKILKEFVGKRYFKVKNKNIRLIICGENNILRNKQKENNDVYFRLEDNDLIKKFQFIIKNTDIFLNSAHTPMGNLGKLKKRWKYLSQNNKICLFTTNEETMPNIKSKPRTKKINLYKKSLQYIFYNGKEKTGTEEITEKYKITIIEIN
jgi:hypothetical protein